MKERGSAMLTAVVAIMVLLLISGIFFSIIVYKAKQDSAEEDALRAYYLAEAGINYEEALVLQAYYTSPYYGDSNSDPKLAGDEADFITQIRSPQFTNATPQTPFNHQETFTVNVEFGISPDGIDYTDGYYFTVKSTGNYNNITRTIEERYQYRKQEQ